MKTSIFSIHVEDLHHWPQQWGKWFWAKSPIKKTKRGKGFLWGNKDIQMGLEVGLPNISFFFQLIIVMVTRRLNLTTSQMGNVYILL